MTSSSTTLPLLLSAALSIWCGAGCTSEEARAELPEGSSAARHSSAVTVSSEAATESPVSRPVVATGSTQPVRASNISPEITAVITEVLVSEGERVEAGQVLMKLNARVARLQAAQARAGAAAATAQAQQMSTDYERLAKLQSQGVVANSKVQQLRAARDATQGQQDAARAAARLAGSMVGNSHVRAPFAGVVSSIMMEVGELASMMPPRVLLRIIDLSEVEVRVSVPERELTRISVGDQVEAHFPSLDERLSGQVTHVGFELHPISRTAEVVTTFANDSDRLRGGMFTELSIQPAAEREAIQLRRTAVGGSGDERFAYTLEDCRARRREVSAQSLGGGMMEITEGLTAGERVVVEGIARLSDGARVEDPAAGCGGDPSRQSGGEGGEDR